MPNLKVLGGLTQGATALGTALGSALGKQEEGGITSGRVVAVPIKGGNGATPIDKGAEWAIPLGQVVTAGGPAQEHVWTINGIRLVVTGENSGHEGTYYYWVF